MAVRPRPTNLCATCRVSDTKTYRAALLYLDQVPPVGYATYRIEKALKTAAPPGCEDSQPQCTRQAAEVRGPTSETSSKLEA